MKKTRFITTILLMEKIRRKFDVKLNVISPGGCLDSLLLSDVITVVNDITGIETSKNVTFSYYPNPVTEKLYLTSSEMIRTLKFSP